MKRFLFAGMIFLLIPCFAQTKAGRTDTMKHAVFNDCSSVPPVTVTVKEQRAAQSVKTSGKKICIPPVNRRRMNLSAKELMKMQVTRSTN